jgi:hypothetical protein
LTNIDKYGIIDHTNIGEVRYMTNTITTLENFYKDLDTIRNLKGIKFTSDDLFLFAGIEKFINFYMERKDNIPKETNSDNLVFLSFGVKRIENKIIPYFIFELLSEILFDNGCFEMMSTNGIAGRFYGYNEFLGMLIKMYSIEETQEILMNRYRNYLKMSMRKHAQCVEHFRTEMENTHNELMRSYE